MLFNKKTTGGKPLNNSWARMETTGYGENVRTVYFLP
jgi:hypothetical protein